MAIASICWGISARSCALTPTVWPSGNTGPFKDEEILAGHRPREDPGRDCPRRTKDRGIFGRHPGNARIPRRRHRLAIRHDPGGPLLAVQRRSTRAFWSAAIVSTCRPARYSIVAPHESSGRIRCTFRRCGSRSITRRLTIHPNLDRARQERTRGLVGRGRNGGIRWSFHGRHSSPALGTIAGREQLIWGSGSGVVYAFDPDFALPRGGKPARLKTVWQFRCVDPATYDTNSSTSAPRKAGNRRLAGHLPQPRLRCRRATTWSRRPPGAAGAVAVHRRHPQRRHHATGKIWSFDNIRSSVSTVAIADGLLYTADAGGTVYCLDAETGRSTGRTRPRPSGPRRWWPTARCFCPRIPRGSWCWPREKRNGSSPNRPRSRTCRPLRTWPTACSTLPIRSTSMCCNAEQAERKPETPHRPSIGRNAVADSTFHAPFGISEDFEHRRPLELSLPAW